MYKIDNISIYYFLNSYMVQILEKLNLTSQTFFASINHFVHSEAAEEDVILPLSNHSPLCGGCGRQKTMTHHRRLSLCIVPVLSPKKV